ncbi:hypothetical protein CDD82_4576 [Ophiocordyceps australis]|uniref:Mitochondrial import inner membrane translocase subunit TIM50 n=1 Tax=Ophiocordyceps australis TaxID=1399860 RepID=A0A2C5ZSQ5_9HYPO|nr:hypothetical protein CDD82_4576 [Ophiocordyceps australis]
MPIILPKQQMFKSPSPSPNSPVRLPDLTRGLPPTFGQETHNDESSGQALRTVERDLDKSHGPRGKRESYIPSSERNRRWWIRFIINSAALASVFLLYHMGRQWDEEEAARHSDIPNGISVTLWWKRMRARIKESISYYQDPAFDKLLPDPIPALARPYTLCLSLDDLLIHSEWTREHGWRVAKRPGLDYFIRYLSQYYELVLFTTVPSMFAEPLIRKMDPFRFIMWPLFREATKFENGEIVKDLSYLNRDLSKVIIIDTNPSHVRKQPENAIILEPWKGDPQDKDLVGLIPFLEYIHTVEYSDVRDVLKSFEGKHIPTEFARREAIARHEHQKQLEEKRKAHSKTSGLAMLGNLLGLKASNMSMTAMADGEQSPSEAFAQGKMLQDIVRERGQRSYEAMEKDIRENGEKWLKEEQQAMEKAQKEAMDQVQEKAMKSVVDTIASAFKPFSEGSQEGGK